MAYCVKCGQKNPDGAAFCSACGARLQMNDTPEENPASQPGSFRVNIPHRDGTPPRRESAPPAQDRWRSRANERKRDKESDNAYDANQANRNKGGKVGGCLKRMLMWGVGLIVVLSAIAWGVSKCGSGNGQDGNKGKTDDMTNIERIMSKSALDSLMEKKGNFEKDNGDVIPRPGRYEGKAAGQPIFFDVMPEPNGKILGKVHVEMDGETIRDCVYAYCGNGIYALYFGESIYEDPDEFFQALPDHETIDYKNGYTGITVTYKGPLGAQEGSDNASVSNNITKCMDEERLASVIRKEGFPETNENYALKYGTYNFKASKGSETHTMSFRLERYDGSNNLIAAKMSMLADNKEVSRGYVGYCGSCIYALYMREIDTDPYEDDDIKMNKHTNDYFYANSDGSISMYFDGKEKIRLKQGEMETVDLN